MHRPPTTTRIDTSLYQGSKVDTSNAPASITLIAPNAGPGIIDLTYSNIARLTGLYRFDWKFTNTVAPRKTYPATRSTKTVPVQQFLAQPDNPGRQREAEPQQGRHLRLLHQLGQRRRCRHSDDLQFSLPCPLQLQPPAVRQHSIGESGCNQKSARASTAASRDLPAARLGHQQWR